MTLCRWHDRSESRTLYALDALCNKCSAHDESARAACGNKSVSLALGKSFKSHSHGTIFLFLDDSGRLLVNVNNRLGMYYWYFIERYSVFFGSFADNFFIPRKHHLYVKLLYSFRRTFQYLQRGVVPAECVNYYFHRYTSFLLVLY